MKRITYSIPLWLVAGGCLLLGVIQLAGCAALIAILIILISR